MSADGLGTWTRHDWIPTMPKSKRDKKISLTKTTKKTHDKKQAMIDEVRECTLKFSTVYVVGVVNMRNVAVQRVRATFGTKARLFFGRTKLLSCALGRTPSEEHRDGLHQVTASLQGDGEAGLLFTDVPLKEVRAVLDAAQLEEFARAGAPATDSVELAEGPLHQFPHNMEPYLRKLGLPTRLDNGVVTLRCNHAVCREGATLDAEQAKVLQLLGIKMARFKLTLRCRWSEGDYEQYDE